MLATVDSAKYLYEGILRNTINESKRNSILYYIFKRLYFMYESSLYLMYTFTP